MQDWRVQSRPLPAHGEIDARFRVNNKHFFPGLSEILEVEAALEECLSTANLLVSEDR